MGISSAEFDALSSARLREAELLAKGGQYSGAYDLLGYAAECALKALIARQFVAPPLPTPAETKGLHTHRLDELLRRAELEAVARERTRRDPPFDRALSLALQWNSEARYSLGTQKAYEDLHFALTDPLAGVLTWLETFSEARTA